MISSKHNCFKFLYFVVLSIFFLTACGSSNELTYRVTGEDAAKATVSYDDASGNLQKQLVDLPWEITLNVDNDFTADIDVINEGNTGTIICEILLNGQIVGDSSSAGYASCFYSYSKRGDHATFSFVSSSVEGYLSKAQEAIDQEDYDKALQEVDRAIKAAPNFPDVYHLRATIYLKMDKYDQALAAYKRVLELDPERAEAYIDRGAAYSEMGDLDAALADLNTAVEFDPDSVTAFMVRAMIYEQLGNFEAATADVLQVQALQNGRDMQVWVDGKLRQYAAGPKIDARLAFVSKRNESVDIYTINIDGSDEQLLTGQLGMVNDMPVWSPDGQKIAFMSTRDGNKEIYLMDTDGTNVQRLTDHPAVDHMPVWAPTGKAIAFVSERNGNADILIYNLEKQELTQLTNSKANDWHPAWAPKTPELAYISDVDGDPELYIINGNLEIRRLTDNEVGDSQPAWSPDGQWIVFSVTADGQDSDLYLIRPDGTDLQKLTDTPGMNNDPAWSSDSKYVAFTSNRDGNMEIYVMALSGELYRVTNNDFPDVQPTWRP